MKHWQRLTLFALGIFLSVIPFITLWPYRAGRPELAVILKILSISLIAIFTLVHVVYSKAKFPYPPKLSREIIQSAVGHASVKCFLMPFMLSALFQIPFASPIQHLLLCAAVFPIAMFGEYLAEFHRPYQRIRYGFKSK